MPHFISHALAESSSDNPYQHATILVVDDEPHVRETLVAWLTDNGHPVLDAENGVIALDLLRTHTVDAVVADLRMPVLDGFGLLAAMQTEFPDIPFIAISSYGLLKEAVNALKQGAADYLAKPIVDMSMLEHTLSQVLERSELKRNAIAYQKNLELTNNTLKQTLAKIEEDEAAGRRLQFQLLPETDVVIQGLCFERDLITSTTLSGDFADYFEIDANHVGFYIADVSGHGVSSAIVTVLLKSYMHRYLSLFKSGKSASLLDPAKILERLNKNLLASDIRKYLTIFYGVINTTTHILTYSNGGHFPFPILWDGQSACYIGSPTKAVGMFDFATYFNRQIALPQHFALTLATDGLLEIQPDSTMQAKLACILKQVEAAQAHSLSVLIASPLLSGHDITRELAPLDDITLLRLRTETI